MIHSATLVLALLVLPGAQAGTTPVILDFHASWCGPCRQMRPVVQQLAAKKYPIQSVDIDRAPDLAERYRITGVPTFVVVDSEGQELARLSGARPASELAAMYNEAVTQQAPQRRPAAAAEGAGAAQVAAQDAEPPAESDTKLPRPWETVVRIKIFGPSSVGFGSGTIIYSTPDESIILTCAHIFHLDSARQPQVPPSKFPRQIQVDLFDGKLHGLKPAMVHPVETVDGQAIDYDFTADVGLIRIRPGRALPVAPVVPESWTPRANLAMTTVGCSEGNNATAWSTEITTPVFKGLVGNSRYEAIECQHPPKQGRSGGGLFTLDGYIAGVCNFAEPRGGHGLYASPKSIYRLLDRNKLTVCYNPGAAPARGTLLANNPGRGGASTPRTTVRAQNDGLPDSRRIPMPEPDRVGVRLAPLGPGDAAPAEPAATASAAVGGWQAPGGRKGTPGGDGASLASTRPGSRDVQRRRYADAPADAEAAAAQTTDLQMNPAVTDNSLPPPAEQVAAPASGLSRPASPADPGSGWHAARRSGADR